MSNIPVTKNSEQTTLSLRSTNIYSQFYRQEMVDTSYNKIKIQVSQTRNGLEVPTIKYPHIEIYCVRLNYRRSSFLKWILPFYTVPYDSICVINAFCSYYTHHVPSFLHYYSLPNTFINNATLTLLLDIFPTHFFVFH